MPRSPGPCAFGATTEFGWGLTLVALHQDPRGSLDDPVDLDAAVDELRIAVDTCPPDDLRRPSFLCNLGLALKQRHASLRSIADLTEAVERFRHAVGATPPGHRDRPLYQSNLGDALVKRFGILGAQDDIANAIDALAGAVGRTPVDDPARAARISNLSTSLSELARATQSLKVAEDAIESGGSRSS